jgi:hypothetical protein
VLCSFVLVEKWFGSGGFFGWAGEDGQGQKAQEGKLTNISSPQGRRMLYTGPLHRLLWRHAGGVAVSRFPPDRPRDVSVLVGF